MSAIYKCNKCGKEMSKHVNCYAADDDIEHRMYSEDDDNPNSATYWVKFTLQGHQDDLDLCHECANELKNEWIKEFANIEICKNT